MFAPSIGSVTDPTGAASLYGTDPTGIGVPTLSGGYLAAQRAGGAFAPLPLAPGASPFGGVAGLPAGAGFPAPAFFPGTPGLVGPQAPAALQAVEDAVRIACACGIDGCNCHNDAVSEIQANNQLLNHLQQNFQAQQLSQLVLMLALLMQNRGLLNGNRQRQQDDAMAAAAAADDDGHGHGGGGGAASSAGGAGGASNVAGAHDVNGIAVVDRMGKQIGAKIAQQFDSMVAAAKQDGVNLTISSGFRSRAEQERLYAAYKNGTGNLAAKPGTSNHESGEAIDFGGGQAAYDWLRKNAARFGFYNKIASEPWHYSLTGN